MEQRGLTALDANELAMQLTKDLNFEPAKAKVKTLKSILTGTELARFISQKLIENYDFVLEIGLEENGDSMELCQTEFERIIALVKKEAGKQGAMACLIDSRNTLVLKTSLQAEQKCLDSSFHYGHVLIRKIPPKVEDLMELRICVVGNVDAGKSTLLGVLTKNTLDDGRGKARVNLFRFQHEIDSGRTSSVGMEIMGFDTEGNVVTAAQKQKLTSEEICKKSTKVISFLDLAGHEKYLKTTVFGMTGCSPDFVMLMVGANAGFIGMTKEHLGLALALQVPVYVVITKIDMCPPNILESTINQLKKILRSNGVKKIPMFIKTKGDVLMTSEKFVSQRICPIFQVSNVTGDGLDLLKLFINLLHTSRMSYDIDAPTEFTITDSYSVPGVGCVVSGTVINGLIHVGDTLLLGPDHHGVFAPTVVKSIHRKRVNVLCASAGQGCCLALKKVKRAHIRKGMVMVSKNLEPRAIMEFEAEILVLFHSSTIKTSYQAMVHCGGIRQTAQIIHLENGLLRTGDRGRVRFKYTILTKIYAASRVHEGWISSIV